MRHLSEPETCCEFISYVSLQQDLKIPAEHLLSVPSPNPEQRPQSVDCNSATAATATLLIPNGAVHDSQKYPPTHSQILFITWIALLLKYAELLTHLSDLQERPLCTWKTCSFWQFCFDSQVGAFRKSRFRCRWHHKQHTQWRKTTGGFVFPNGNFS